MTPLDSNDLAALPAAAGLGTRLRRLTQFREFILLMIIVLVSAAMSIASKDFFTGDNWQAMFLGMSVESIVAVGMTILMVSGGFDLSVGSTMALAGAVTAFCLAQSVPVPVAIAAGLGVGVAIGVINGLIVAKIGINPFITTLAMMSIVRGVLLPAAQGRNIAGLPEGFKIIGQGSVLQGTDLQVQYPIVIAAVLVIAGDLLLRKSRFFRQNYYIGGNEKAAVLSGISVNFIKVFNYALVGFLAGLGGIVMTARLGTASVTAGTGLELQVITAVIIGGASLQGGEGTVLGSFLGALLMTIVVGSLTFLGVDPYWNTLVIGATLLIAVLIDTLGRRSRN